MSIDLEHFRALLLERRAQLDRAGGVDRGSAVALDQSRVGRLSRMEALQDQAMADAAARRRGTERSRIDAALMRIDEGDYGECEDCGNDIAEGRLAIDPSARLCVACASKRESR